MIDLRSAIQELLEELAEELKDKHKELGMEASGDWIDSVEVQANTFSGSILANDYTVQLVQGRRPGNMPPVDPIERWVQAKLGLSGKEANSAAWGIANKIQKSGTTWYEDGGSDLVDGVITDRRVEKLFEDLGATLAIIIADNLTREFQKVFA